MLFVTMWVFNSAAGPLIPPVGPLLKPAQLLLTLTPVFIRLVNYSWIFKPFLMKTSPGSLLRTLYKFISSDCFSTLGVVLRLHHERLRKAKRSQRRPGPDPESDPKIKRTFGNGRWTELGSSGHLLSHNARRVSKTSDQKRLMEMENSK